MDDGASYWIGVLALAVVLALMGLSAAAVRGLGGWRRAVAMSVLSAGLPVALYAGLEPATRPARGQIAAFCGVAYGGMLCLIAVVLGAVLIGFAIGGVLLYLDRGR